MLKHEDTSQTQSPAAAQVRVTPEELAAAITRLEAKKDAGQRNLEGTVAIGEVVQQLGLDVTPEEVLAEVQAKRQAIPRKRRLTVWDRAVLALGLSGILLGVVVDRNGLMQIQNQQSEQSASISGDDSFHITAASDLAVSDASGKTMMFSEVGDNQPVQCTFNIQSRHFDRAFPGFPGFARGAWTLIKHDGKVYVRGYMMRASQKLLLSGGGGVTTIAGDPNFSVPVTLPLDGFTILPVGSSIQFQAMRIHLDKHAYEKW